MLSVPLPANVSGDRNKYDHTKLPLVGKFLPVERCPRQKYKFRSITKSASVTESNLPEFEPKRNDPGNPSPV